MTKLTFLGRAVLRLKKLLVLNGSAFEGRRMATVETPGVPDLAKLKTNVKFEVLPTPVKGGSDKKEYRVIQLENGLTACLISDPSQPECDEEEGELVESEDEESENDDSSEETDDGDSDYEDEDDSPANEQKMAAAALTINVGSFSDPKAVPGMAHFLEHMVFMGSEKFPEENDFDKFLSKRGGFDNASTDYEYTTFYFECLERDLFEALDKFAQFFISPLMKRCSIEKEREAVDSEFQMSLPSDGFRKEQLLLSLAKEDTPVNSFSWGNLITLRDNIAENDLYDGVHKFRKRHYSAHRMKLALQARFPLDILQAFVLHCFGNVSFNLLPPDDFSHFTNVFDTPQFKKMYYVEPRSDILQVDLTWALPSLLKKYKSKPHQYVSWLLGHEGKGGLMSYLRDKVWVLSLSTGNSESGAEHNTMFAIFSINMTLTDEGFAHLEELVKIVFSYINMIRKLGPQERIYNEIKTVDDIAFRFADEQSASDFVEQLSESMHIYPPEDYLAGSELYFEYDPEGIQSVLDSLVPSKMNMMILSDTLPAGLKYDKKEKWFGTRYAEKEFSKGWLKIWEEAEPLDVFSLPPPNPFIPENFDLLPEDINHPDYPVKLAKSEISELWYRKDQKFKLPIVYYNFYLINPAFLDTPKRFLLMDLYVSLLGIHLLEYTYPAQVAELSYHIKTGDKGIELGFSGYNDKLHVLIELVTEHIVNFHSQLSDEMFTAMKGKLIKNYYNTLLKPKFVARNLRLSLLVGNFHSVLDKYNVANTVTFDDMKKFSKDFIRNLYIKALAQGNISKDHAINVFNNFVTSLNSQPIEMNKYPRFRVSQLPQGERFCVIDSFDKTDSNSVITNYYQSGVFTLKDNAIIELLVLIIEEPLFNTLRTQEKLSYDVSCSFRDTFGVLGFSITVNAQATKHSTQFVQDRIEEFIKVETKELKQMDLEEFEAMKKDLIKTKQVCDLHLKEEFSRNWSEIVEDDYMFDKLKIEIAAIEEVTLKEVQDWWTQHTLGEKLKKLSVQVTGFKNVGDASDDEIKLQKPTTLAYTFQGKSGSNIIKAEGQRDSVVINDIVEFREKLFMYPYVSKISNIGAVIDK